MNYVPLEPSFTSSLTSAIPGGLSLESGSFIASTSFLYGAAIMVIIVTAGLRYGLAGIWRIEASERGVTKSNKEIKRVTIGLLGVLSLFLLISTVNRDLLRGDVKFENLGSGGGSVQTNTNTGGGTGTNTGTVGGTGVTTGSGNTSVSCESKENTIRSLTTSAGVCGQTSCTVLTGCKYQDYISTLKQESQRQGVDVKMAIVIMCRESRGDKLAQRKNQNGSYDCGLMQINQNTPCDATILDPTTNIAKGIALIKKIKNSGQQVYPNIPSETGIFASYNCCANGTIPNAPSNDCTQASGFPYTIPKWACPINPGDSTYNMCTVKKYTCELTKCLQDPSLNGM